MSAFETAAAEVKHLKAKPSDQEMLELYSLYKVGTQSNFAEAPKPGTFDFAGKYKYNGWKRLHDEGVTSDEAQERYIFLVEALKEKYGS
ncbi:hypothetical protein CBS63078_7422 [Aspergillus niger]|uniref:Contig An03c0070, genomic contig n=5 Tax=Aspergillus TaxID=5052 RepID=A2QG43_ASPNC|nr:uncharacterized protein An03g01800 [Aspergillus niger]XP_025453170.1 acyl-CoA-binding protein [Aspergillus niger CBS 101883]EHA21033.1 hypothetical protein ASPNIDRAFT_194452 [Aspergillus niger ATCC 1015]RDH19539.1 acyl-CoA-binding protein [Aspergillus niger ATCC 13496]RDK38604.1 acyl-CoA-binding protein [Aspergillus phoenicis ATCC 13157]KAI2816058.1 hypothetical protein CBS115989_7122 [Aspergillus niger]KAI2857735.1 hypothetical protein CBS11232_3107 [Aspergillus niger]|eukprot:XP_001390082.1 acyl CoA binding family protein [Aspergillus niger CBS 513.88]